MGKRVKIAVLSGQILIALLMLVSVQLGALQRREKDSQIEALKIELHEVRDQLAESEHANDILVAQQEQLIWEIAILEVQADAEDTE